MSSCRVRTTFVWWRPGERTVTLEDRRSGHWTPVTPWRQSGSCVSSLCSVTAHSLTPSWSLSCKLLWRNIYRRLQPGERRGKSSRRRQEPSCICHSEGRQMSGGQVVRSLLSSSLPVRCPTAADAAAVSIAQMTFLATSMNILSIVANINNNLNNNNNNNNQGRLHLFHLFKKLICPITIDYLITKYLRVM